MKPSLYPIIGMMAFMGRVPMERRPFDITKVEAPKPSVYGHGKRKWIVDGIEVIANSKSQAQWKANQIYRNQ